MNNLKIVIPILVTITIIVIIFNLTQTGIVEEQVSEFENSSKIQNILDKIKKNKLDNDSSDNPYTPKEREWIQSGPFKIDRSEYIVGEKIFINIEEIDEFTKGEMVFYKQMNNTYGYTYKTIPFDGLKPQQNLYLSLDLSELRGICTIDMLTGDWKLIFEGTNFESLKFKVTDQIIPGMERRYEPVC
mgnify:FL=1|jgi:hypothetical protein